MTSIKRSSFETEIVFRTIFMQRSIHLVYFCYVKSFKSVKYIKFILAVYFVFCLAKEVSLLELSLLVFSLSPMPIRLPFPNLTKIGDLDFCIFNREEIIQLRRVEMLLDGPWHFFFLFKRSKIMIYVRILLFECLIKINLK